MTQEEASSKDAPMIATVKEYLDSGGRTYQMQPLRDDGSAIISMTLTGKASTFRTFIDLKIPQDRLLVFVESPVKVPEGEKRALCAELLMRINYTLALGSFEIDFRDGEVRYRMSVDVEGSSLSLPMVETYLMVPAATMDRWFPALMACVYGGKTPLEAIEEARNPPAPVSQTSSSQ